jgi:catechol 2,3-dioxygenase
MMDSPSAMTRQADIGIPPKGFRLPSGTHVRHVRLQVSNLARSTEFYQQVLGMEVVTQSADTLSLGPTPTNRALVHLFTRPGVRPVHRKRTLGLFHFAILLPSRADLGRFLRHVSKLGIRIGLSDHLVSDAVYLSDPDGLGIEVYADRPRDTWNYEGAQIVMSTEPMDVDSVLQAGADSEWTGMPAGTRMGHIHLHVGNLDKAREFYHQALGFDLTVWNYPGALFLSAGGYHHHLAVNTWAPAVKAHADDARLLEWELAVPAESLPHAAASLKNAGYAVESNGPDWTTSDPWGTVVRLAVA